MLLLRFPSLPSTQDWLRHWARLGAAESLAVQAAEQTAGRGRLDRSWWSPSGGGLYLSVLLRPAIPLGRASHLTMLVSLAAIDACRTAAQVDPRPKWPNDLLVSGRKLAGVLTEIEANDDRLHFAIIGLGLNVNMSFAHTPLAETAISLSDAASREIDIEAVRDAFLTALERRYRRFTAGESPLAEWQERLEPLGRRVRVQMDGRSELFGRASGVHPDGALLVEDDAGLVHTLWAGDVIPLPDP